jgi:6-phospho-3-hexuloisomerase
MTTDPRQPAIDGRDIFVTQLTELTTVLHQVDPIQFAEVTRLLATCPRIFLTAHGRNGLALQAFANRLMQLNRPVNLLGDILAGPVRAGDVLVIASSSGTTPALLARADAAHHHDALAVALTATHPSPLTDRADQTLHLALPGSVQPLGTLFEQALTHVCDALTQALMTTLHISEEDMRERHANLE